MTLRYWGAIVIGALWAVAAGAGAATFFVNIGTNGSDANLNDNICDSDLATGGLQCTLRAAIEQANFLPGPDNIFFDLPTGINPALPTLSFNSALPNITDTVALDASTQPVFGRVELSGLFAGAGSKGLVIQSNDCIVRNFIINRFLSSGIVLRQGGGHKIEGCFIGVNSSGGTARANGLDGILIESSSNNTIGGLLAAQRNVISGNNRNGIMIMQLSPQAELPADNVIVGNLIGTTSAGSAKLANAVNGILIDSGLRTRIGAADAAGSNVISGNNAAGLRIAGTAASTMETMILGNIIGATQSGLAPLGNATSGIFVDVSGTVQIGDRATTPGLAPGNVIVSNLVGITMQGVAGQVRVQGNSIGAGPGGAPILKNTQDGIRAIGASRNVSIGGTLDFTGNLIAHNGESGVAIAPTASQIAMLRNSMISNTGLGIDLGENGHTPNDSDDSDSGANGLQNFPELLIAGTRAGRLRVDGTLVSNPETDFRVEFFSNSQCDPVGFGEGEIFLGFTDVKTNEDGETIFSVFLPQPPPPDHLITATATTTDGNTSEFSACEEIVVIDIEGLMMN